MSPTAHRPTHKSLLDLVGSQRMCPELYLPLEVENTSFHGSLRMLSDLTLADTLSAKLNDVYSEFRMVGPGLSLGRAEWTEWKRPVPGPSRLFPPPGNCVSNAIFH